MRERDRLAALKATSRSPDEDEGKKNRRADKKRKTQQMTANTALARRIMQAGFNLPERVYLSIVAGITFFASCLAYQIGPILAMVVAVLIFQFLLFGFLEERAIKRKRKIAPQLAPFIDGLASELSTGFNLEAAIAQAAVTIPPGPLRIELDRVVSGLNSGLAAKEAMGILRDRVAGSEVTALVVAISLFASMGGHALEPFRRLATKIREQQNVMDRAMRDLVLVKQAFVIILVISMGVPGILAIIAPGFLGGAFKTSLGRLLVQGALLMQVAAIVFFKKVTNLRI